MPSKGAARWSCRNPTAAFQMDLLNCNPFNSPQKQGLVLDQIIYLMSISYGLDWVSLCKKAGTLFDNPSIPFDSQVLPIHGAPRRCPSEVRKFWGQTASQNRSGGQWSTNAGLSVSLTPDHIAVIGHQQGMHIEILSLVSPLEFRAPFSGQAALYRVLPHPNTSETPLFRCTEPTSTTMKSQKGANFQWTLPSDKMLRSCTYQFWSLCVAGGQQPRHCASGVTLLIPRNCA